MIATLLRWLGIASAADVAEARKEASFEAESLWAGYQTLNGRLIAATAEITAQREIILDMTRNAVRMADDTVALRKRVEALEEQQPQRKPREHA